MLQHTFDVPYVCLRVLVDDWLLSAVVFVFTFPFSSSRWTAIEKRRQKAGSRTAVILVSIVRMLSEYEGFREGKTDLLRISIVIPSTGTSPIYQMIDVDEIL